MSINTIIFLSEISLDYGLIGIDEFMERADIAKWLSDKTGGIPDPRRPKLEVYGDECQRERNPERELQSAQNSSMSTSKPTDDAEDQNEEDDPFMFHFVFNGKWHFTGSDPDPYPSVPHGHEFRATKSWPKLNPYSGRVFSGKHQEAVRSRLSKSEMRRLWNDPVFCDFCRRQVLWYLEEFPFFKFKVKRHLRFPRW